MTVRLATRRRRTRTADQVDIRGADLTTAYRAGAEILAGTAAFPATGPHQGHRYPIRCDQCPGTWLIGDSQQEAQTRFADHHQQSHP